jgi:hypothetical protein
VSQQAELARRYRQRLALYPRAYRRDHEEEMLAVLLEGARAGQEFPRIAESADLIWGALRMRMRLGCRYPGNVGSDALAVFSLLAPLLLVGPVLATMTLHLVQAGPPPDPQFHARVPLLFQRYDARVTLANGLNLAVAGQLAIATAVVLRLRRLALAAIAVILAWWIFGPGYAVQPGDVFDGLFLTCYLLEAVALIASPGPRRGLQLLTWKSGAALAVAGAVLTVTWTLTMRLDFPTAVTSSADAYGNAVAVVALITFATAVVLFSQLGRYVTVLFAAVFYPYGLFLARIAGATRGPFLMRPGIAFSVLYVPPILAMCGIVALAYRPRDGRVRNSPRGTSARA